MKEDAIGQARGHVCGHLARAKSVEGSERERKRASGSAAATHAAEAGGSRKEPPIAQGKKGLAMSNLYYSKKKNTREKGKNI